MQIRSLREILERLPRCYDGSEIRFCIIDQGSPASSTVFIASESLRFGNAPEGVGSTFWICDQMSETVEIDSLKEYIA